MPRLSRALDGRSPLPGTHPVSHSSGAGGQPGRVGRSRDAVSRVPPVSGASMVGGHAHRTRCDRRAIDLPGDPRTVARAVLRERYFRSDASAPSDELMAEAGSGRDGLSLAGLRSLSNGQSLAIFVKPSRRVRWRAYRDSFEYGVSSLHTCPHTLHLQCALDGVRNVGAHSLAAHLGQTSQTGRRIGSAIAAASVQQSGHLSRQARCNTLIGASFFI